MSAWRRPAHETHLRSIPLRHYWLRRPSHRGVLRMGGAMSGWWNNDSWRDGYDAWKLASPPEYTEEDEAADRAFLLEQEPDDEHYPQIEEWELWDAKAEGRTP